MTESRPGDAHRQLRREHVLDTLHRVRDRPPPADPTSGGCVAAIVALISLMFMPFVARATNLDSSALFGVGIGLGLVVLVGGVVGVFGGAFRRGATVGDTEEAIGQLLAEFPDGDSDLILEASIRILLGAMLSVGPTTVSGYDAGEVAERLGGVLPYVVEVERILLDGGLIYPVFTML